jgi:DNA polymerase III subunit epsilon
MAKLVGGLDFETTGFSHADGDRIVEVALLIYDLDTRLEVGRMVETVNPMRPVPAAATAVHGYTFEMLAGSRTIDAVFPELIEQINRLDGLVIHNAPFDVSFLVGEAVAQSIPVPKVDAFCTMTNGRWSTYDGKVPSLREVCEATGVPYDPDLAHKAEYDVDRMMQAFFVGLDTGFFKPEFMELA